MARSDDIEIAGLEAALTELEAQRAGVQASIDRVRRQLRAAQRVAEFRTHGRPGRPRHIPSLVERAAHDARRAYVAESLSEIRRDASEAAHL